MAVPPQCLLIDSTTRLVIEFAPEQILNMAWHQVVEFVVEQKSVLFVHMPWLGATERGCPVSEAVAAKSN
jgi:hypothetical protein